MLLESVPAAESDEGPVDNTERSCHQNNELHELFIDTY